jgi:hydrogenase maturation protein HypF
LKIVRKKINVQGIVQGVGFRPFIYNLAVSNKLTGFVSNTSQGVIIEVEGTSNKINQFVDDIKLKAPPIAVITDIQSSDIAVTSIAGFNIVKSDRNEKISTLISPDVAVCDDCLSELFDPNDRRYQYPFINCTNCGPRYTIIDNIPYDRPYTSMKHFKMCTDCQTEYDDPTNRRFHAQPNACPTCGPQVKLFDSKQKLQNVDDVIATTREKLKDGKIVRFRWISSRG